MVTGRNEDKAYAVSLIAKGEGQHLDFKYHIADAAKIAKTLVAFANSPDGGRLLIGVKDNGKIKGVASEEEIFMIEHAAEDFCLPPVITKMNELIIDGKCILEVIIPESLNKPHFAKSEDKKWIAYVRVADENILANRVFIEVEKRKKKQKNTVIRYTDKERILLSYLKENETITMQKFIKLANISPVKARHIIVNLVSVGVLKLHISKQSNFYTLEVEEGNED
jgi:predicted HTH transcriptional regulator